MQTSCDFQMVGHEDRHSNFCDESDDYAPDAFMRVGYAFGDEQSVAGVENDVDNQGVERVADQTRCAKLDEIHMFGCRGAARFNSQAPQQHDCAEKFDDAVDTECL